MRIYLVMLILHIKLVNQDPVLSTQPVLLRKLSTSDTGSFLSINFMKLGGQVFPEILKLYSRREVPVV